MLTGFTSKSSFRASRFELTNLWVASESLDSNSQICELLFESFDLNSQICELLSSHSI